MVDDAQSVCYYIHVHVCLHLRRSIIAISVFFPSDAPEKTASYSLYVIGSNGVLTEHVLLPQRLSTATEGEDAPIELTRVAKTCWRLMG